MFLQASVILLTGGEGGTSPPPPGADTPLEQTPPPEQTLPWEQTPPEQNPPEQTPPGSRPPPGQHAVRYGQRVGGTHPAGMQSCLVVLLRKKGVGEQKPKELHIAVSYFKWI